MANLVKKGFFLGQKWPTSGSCLFLMTCKPLFTNFAIENPNFQFWVKILVCPNFLVVTASTDIERGPKFQLETVQNMIGMWVKPDKSWCILCNFSMPMLKYFLKNVIPTFGPCWLLMNHRFIWLMVNIDLWNFQQKLLFARRFEWRVQI